MIVRSQVDSAAISYNLMGQGPDVVLLHPFPASHLFWSPIADQLSQRYRLILPDLRGHGASTLGDPPALMAKHAADVAAVCRDAGVTRAVFVGVSIGGYILFEFWRSHRQHVRALVLANTKAAADTPEAAAARLQSAEDVLQRGPGAFLDGLFPKLIGETTRRNRPDVAAHLRRLIQQPAATLAANQQGMAARPDSISTLPTINVPTLIIAADEDTATPLPEAQLMHQQIRASRLAVIPQAGHYALHERPDDALRLLRTFLDSLPG